MGTWGYKHFENDSAFDYSSMIENSDNPKEILKDTFGHTLQMDNISADQGQALIAFAAYVDRQTNGTKYSDDTDLLDVDTFPQRHPDLDFTDIKEVAYKAVLKVLDKDSELNELWEENEEEYPLWIKEVEGLIERLKK